MEERRRAMSLNYLVKVTTIANRPLSEKEWEPIARRIAKAVKGRSKCRQVSVWAEMPYHLVAIDEGGRMTIRKGDPTYDLCAAKK